MASGLVVASASGAKLRNYSGVAQEAERAGEVCVNVYNMAFAFAPYGFSTIYEVSYDFEQRRVALLFADDTVVSVDCFIASGTDAVKCTGFLLRDLVCKFFSSESGCNF